MKNNKIAIVTAIVLAAICLTAWWGIAMGKDEIPAATSRTVGRHTQIPLGDLRLTVVYDNYPGVRGLKSEWGFSCLIEGAEKTILFDTGADAPVLLANMDSLAIRPEDIDIVILSHEHWDHTGGLGAFLERNPSVTVYVPRSFERAFKKRVIDSGAEIVEVGEPARICSSVYSTGELGGSIKEQSLMVCTDGGMIVMTGCAHPGIGLIVKKARELIPDEVLLAMGGFHMARAGEDEISDVVASLREAGVLGAGPCHCSGDNARRLFRAAYGDRYLDIGAGTILTSADFE